MPEGNERNAPGVNPKLVNALVILGIVCAVTFLALWAIPTLTQKAGEMKDQATADALVRDNSQESAAAFLEDYVLTKGYLQNMRSELDYKATYMSDLVEAVNEAERLRGRDDAAQMAGSTMKAEMEGVYYFFKVEPTYKASGGPFPFPHVYLVYKYSLTDEWQVK